MKISSPDGGGSGVWQTGTTGLELCAKSSAGRKKERNLFHN